MTNTGFSRSLTVPDSLTSWEANAVCFTKDRGLWMPENKPLLTVSMPFFIEFTPPLVARRGEILHLPVSVFVYPPTHNVTSKQCYEVDVGLEVDPQDWRMIGASEFTTCICTGDLKETFKLPLRPLRIGQLNVTATATAARGSAMCGGDGRNVVVVGDAVRRSVRVVAEGVEKSLTRGGTFCTTGGTYCLVSPHQSVSSEFSVVGG
uniref:A2M domain-containing protein n=2 Tax=Mesocestoides corti TaxID=53468 RepID=A0A5K3G1C3_MESCO